MYCTLSGFLNFYVSHLNYEKFNLCLQNTLNTLNTTRVYFGVLQTKLCIPRTSFRDLLIWEMHSGGLTRHFGRDKTIASVEDRFYWPSLKKDVARIVAQCRTCRLAKAKK